MTVETQLLLQVLATVLTTVLSVLGALWWLDRKINSTRLELQQNIQSLDTKLTGEIKSLDEKQTAEIKALDTKLTSHINAVDTKHSGEIKEVRLASEAAHKDILANLGSIRVEQAAQSERLKCVERRLDLLPPEE